MKSSTLPEAVFVALGLFALSVVFSVTAMEAALFLTLFLLLNKSRGDNNISTIRPFLTQHPLFLPWMLYLGICLLTAVTAYYPAKGLGQFNSDLLKYVCLSTLLLAVKKEHLPGLSALYTASAAVAAIIGIAETARSLNAGDLVVQRANAFMNAVRYGEVMAIALTLILSRIALQIKETFRHENLFYKLAALPVFAALMLSQTRGAYLGTFAAVSAMIYFSGRARKKVVLCAVILASSAAIIGLSSPVMRQRVTAISHTLETGTTDQAINIRLELWKLGLTMFKAHPMIGVGPDNIKKVFKKFHPGQIGNEKAWGSLHNLYIHQAAERGILGLAALLLLFGRMFSFALKRHLASNNSYTLWALCVLPAFYVMNFTEISFQHVHTSFAIFLALAFASAAE